MSSGSSGSTDRKFECPDANELRGEIREELKRGLPKKIEKRDT
jgi:hypothetical protein